MTRIGATGHQTIPDAADEYIRAGISSVLATQQRPVKGVCSLAAGADQLFADTVLAHGGQLHVVIPSRGYETTFESSDDRGAFHALVAAAEQVETLPYSRPSEDAFLAAGRRVVDLADFLVAVWDGRHARGKGGTADVVAYARANAKRVQVIWPLGVDR